LESLKRELLRLLREDEEFRYAVAGALGLSEILEELKRFREDFKKYVELEERRWEDNEKKWEDNRRRWEENNRKWEENIRRWEEENKRWMENNKRWEENNKRWEENNRRWRDNEKKWEEAYKRFEAIELELKKLREDFNRGFEALNRRLDALGARWGLLAEEAFKEGIRGIVERDLGLRVSRWLRVDASGEVFGYPATIEIDVAIRDDKVILVEVKSNVKDSDVRDFKRKASFYEKTEGRRPDRLIIITPYADPRAYEAARHLGIEIYTKV